MAEPTLPASTAGDRSRWGAGVVAPLVATLLYFHRAALTGDVFLARDLIRGCYPLRDFWTRRVLAGELPEWFPYDGLGQPFISMVVSGAFHPVNLLHLFLPLGAALKWNVLLCYPAAWVGAYLLTRRLGAARGPASLAGVAFAFSGYLTGISNNVPYLIGAATVPWVLLAADRLLERPTFPRAGATAVALALILLGGETETFVVTGALIPLWMGVRAPAGRRRQALLWSGAALALGIATAAIQFLPSVLILGDVSAGSRTLEKAQLWSVHPLQLVELLLGSIYGGFFSTRVSADISTQVLGLGQSTPWVESLHVGLPVVLLALTAAWSGRRRAGTRWFAAGVLAFVLLTLGKHLALYGLVFRLVPLFRPFRYPVKLMPFVVLGLAVAAGVGLQALEADATRRRRWSKVAGLAGLLCAGLALGERAWKLFSHGVVRAIATTPDDVYTRLGQAFEGAAWQTCAALVAMAVIAHFARASSLRGALPSFIVGLQLFLSGEPLLLIGLEEAIIRPPAFAETLRSIEGPPALGRPRVVDLVGESGVPELDGLSWVDRVALWMEAGLSSDAQAKWGLESSNLQMPAASGRYRELAAEGAQWFARYAPLFNTGYVVFSGRRYAEMNGPLDRVVAESRTFGQVLVRIPEAKPRAYLARPRCVEGREAARAVIANPSALGPDEAVVECLAGQRTGAMSATPGTVLRSTFAPERVELGVQAGEGAVLVLNDAYYAGWTATVDGAPAPLLPANHSVRGVLLPAGEHTVVFRFQTPGLRAGMAVTGLALLAPWLLEWWRRRRRALTPPASAPEAARA